MELWMKTDVINKNGPALMSRYVYSSVYCVLTTFELLVLAVIPFIVAARYVSRELAIVIWVVLAAYIVVGLFRIWAVSLKIDMNGLVVRSIFRKYTLTWIDIRSIHVSDKSTKTGAASSYVITLETRRNEAVTAWASAFGALMPALYTLTPLAGQNVVPLDIPEEIREKLERYIKKRAG
jgi:hypothetical protein